LNVNLFASVYICLFVWWCIYTEGPSWSCSYGSWIYNYLCNQCLSPLILRVRISIRARCTTLCDKVCQCHFQQYFSYIMAVSFIGGGNGVTENTTDLLHITDKLYHITLCTSPWSRFELAISVMIGTDCIGSIKQIYRTPSTVKRNTYILRSL
jgi:hypothetical protein